MASRAQALSLTQVTTPVTPAAGQTLLYIKSDNKVYTKTSAGTEAEVGTGTGGASTDELLIQRTLFR